MASWKIPELNGGIIRKCAYGPFYIAMFDYRRVSSVPVTFVMAQTGFFSGNSPILGDSKIGNLVVQHGHILQL